MVEGGGGGGGGDHLCSPAYNLLSFVEYGERREEGESSWRCYYFTTKREM